MKTRTVENALFVFCIVALAVAGMQGAQGASIVLAGIAIICVLERR